MAENFDFPPKDLKASLTNIPTRQILAPKCDYPNSLVDPSELLQLTRAGGVHGDALPRIPGRVLPLADQDRPAARRGPERGARQADAAAAGPAGHLVEGHLVPLRAQKTPDHALSERRQFHHHPGESSRY